MSMSSDKPDGTVTGFRELGIREAFCAKLRERSIVEPAPVQRNAIPVLMAGKDAVIESGTGTGKTLAYLLPMLEAIDLEANRLQGLVMAPTPELAMQIVRLAAELAGGNRTLALIGGASRQRQIEKLKVRPPLVVGTPGRLAELLRLGKLKTGDIRFAVVDEADQVFQPGAGEEAEAVLAALPPDRQLAFVSATIGPATIDVATKWMKDPVRPGGQSQAEVFAGVTHEYAICDRRDKIDLVRRFVRTVRPRTAILFVGDTDRIGEIEAKLNYAGIAAEPLYADAGKRERADAMRRLSAGTVTLVIATDLAARGLDVPHLTHVINFEPPADEQTYLHRAGRTGRMGRTGTVVTLATPSETARLRRLAKRLLLPLRQMVLSHGQWVPAAFVPASAKGLPAAGKGRPAAGAIPARKKRMGEPDMAGARESGDARPAGSPATREASASGKPPVKPSAKPTGSRGKKPETGRRRERDRDTKNKGAPRWLKEKQKRDPG